MNLRLFALSTLAAGTAMWILAGIWHEMVMANFYAVEAHASHEGTGLIFIAYLILGGLMTYLYSLGYRGQRPVIEGLRYGVVIGVLWVFPHELAMAGAHGTSIMYVLQNAAWHMVEQGVGGIVTGVLYARMTRGKKDGVKPV